MAGVVAVSADYATAWGVFSCSTRPGDGTHAGFGSHVIDICETRLGEFNAPVMGQRVLVDESLQFSAFFFMHIVLGRYSWQRPLARRRYLES